MLNIHILINYKILTKLIELIKPFSYVIVLLFISIMIPINIQAACNLDIDMGGNSLTNVKSIEFVKSPRM